MPQDIAEDVDWSGLRASAVMMGIKPAARAACSHLPPDEQTRFIERVAKRASREGWEAHRVSTMSTLTTAPQRQGGTQPAPLSTAVHDATQIQAEANADNSRRSRAAALRYSARNLEHLAEMNPEEGVLLAPQAASITKVAATAGGWADQSNQTVRINVLAASGGAVQIVTDKDSSITA
jgi:hypothetical protein